MYDLHISLTSSCQCSATSLPRGCFTRLTPVRRRSHDLPKRHGDSDPADRDSAGSNSVLTTADVSCSRISHISSLAPVNFPGVIRFFVFCHRLFLPSSATKHRRFSMVFHRLPTRSIRWKSPVISCTLARRHRWLTVSHAADSSTKTAPVVSPFSNPSSR